MTGSTGSVVLRMIGSGCSQEKRQNDALEVEFSQFEDRLGLVRLQGVRKLGYPPPPKIEIGDLWLKHLELEFEAHILCVWSTDQYSKLVEYELQTPTLSGSTKGRQSLFLEGRVTS